MHLLNSRFELLASAFLRMMLLIFAYYSYKNGALPTELKEHFYFIVVFATTVHIYAHISKSIFLLIPKISVYGFLTRMLLLCDDRFCHHYFLPIYRGAHVVCARRPLEQRREQFHRVMRPDSCSRQLLLQGR